MPHASPPDGSTALVLSGGGARAAYQVGVLQAIAGLRAACGHGHGGAPFDIFSGTSAGAINAAALASGADHFDHAVRRIARAWAHVMPCRSITPTRCMSYSAARIGSPCCRWAGRWRAGAACTRIRC